MTIRQQIQLWIERRKAEVEKGREITLQQQAERKRKKLRKAMERKPGAVKALQDGMIYHRHPLDVMKDEWDRRKELRKENEHAESVDTAKKN